MRMHNSGSLCGQTALVTGAARRIGRAIVLGLAEAGANVVVHYRSSHDEAATTAAAARERGVCAWPVQADLGDPTAAAGLLNRAAEAAGPIDWLVNNASIFERSTLQEFRTEDLHRHIQINALAPLALARALAVRGRPGAVVNLLDTRVLVYDRANVAYHLSKRMLLSLTRMMALEFAPAVRVNAVAPGLILAPAGKGPDHVARLAERVPLRRSGNVADVVDAALFLLRSDFVTGQVIYVDGGYHMRGRTYE
jgi:hypothetical protein